MKIQKTTTPSVDKTQAAVKLDRALQPGLLPRGADLAALSVQSKASAKRRAGSLDELQDELLEKQALEDASAEGVVMSDATGMVVAQLDTALIGSGSVGATSTAATAASGLSGFVSGVEAVGGASAGAASASVATISTITSSASVASVGTLSGLVGGVALVAGGGGGGSEDPTITTPEELPPENPYPGTDPETLDLSASSSAVDVHRTTVAGTSLPSLILNKSLVIDLGAVYGALNGTLYHTQLISGAEFTHVLTYKNILNVKGTAVNDQITGNAAANLLDGGEGDDVIYGDGGLDTLRGNDGNDWILFKPLTRSSGAGAYDDGVFLSLEGQDDSLLGVVGLFKNASQTGSVFAEASDFENAVGSDGNDVLLGSVLDNVLDGAGGDDVLMGGDGNDVLFDGVSGAWGNQLWGQVGDDAFVVGYAINPVARAFYADPQSNGISQVAGTSVLRDWDAGHDSIKISGVGIAVMGGLYGQADWTQDDVVDLGSGVINFGAIHVAAGAANNQIYGSSGTEYLWVGYQYLATNATLNASSASQSMIDGMTAQAISDEAVDILWTWDDQRASRDYLNVAASGMAVIGGLQGVTGWGGNDTVDLRTGVTNLGTIVLAAGVGNNLLYGSAGKDLFYGATGTSGTYNQVWGGSGVNEYYVGWTYDTGTLDKGVSAVSRDIIWDWHASAVLDVSSSGVAVLGMLRGQSNWNANDAVDLSGANVTNDGIIVIAMGAGQDTLTGSDGVDHIYGGASTGVGNQLRGGDGADYFFTGFNYDPVTAAASNDVNGRLSLGSGEVGLDVIHDWQNNTDRLQVGSVGKLVMGGLYGASGWAGNDSVDLSSNVDNQGVIVIAAGAGINQIYGSSGTEQYWSGYEYLASSGVINGAVAPTVSSASTDSFWRWDDKSARRDSLNVSSFGIAQIAGLQGASNWLGNDTVDLRTQVANAGLIRVAAGSGNNTLYGSSGNDEFNVGYEVSTTSGNPVVASALAAVDFLHGWNARNWTTSTWYPTPNWNGLTDATDTTYDRINVAAGSRAFLASLSGMDASNATRWDGNDIVDLRSSVNNAGDIVVWMGNGNDIVYGSAGRELIYGGAGLDNLYGGAGDDLFYVGYSPQYAPGGADNAESRIWDWQNGTSDAAPGDGLRVSSTSFALISGLYGMNPQDANRWDRLNDVDTVDLRWDVLNEGKIIVETGAGDDVIWGSSGVDYLLGGDGLNTYNLANGGADRVYIDSYVGRQQISGFGSDDKVYLDKRILDTFRVNKGIQTISNYNVTLTADKTTAGLWAGKSYANGDFSLSEKTYDAAYNRTLGSFNGTPSTVGFSVFGSTFGWQSGGAWNNDAYSRSYDLGRAALISASSASLALGYGLMSIPFVGPLLAIAPLTIGGLMLNDSINNLRPHQNATYSGVWDGGVNMLNSNATPGSDVGTWDTPNFLSFYQKPNDKFMPSLEITGQQGGLAGTQVGVASYVTVFNGKETFIYLVFSKDGIIQDNETRLIAQVNGLVNANQLVIFDGAADADYQRYFQNSVDAPVFPPNASMLDSGFVADGAGKVLFSVFYTQASTSVKEYADLTRLAALRADTSVSDLMVIDVLTNDSTPTLTFKLDNDLVATDVVALYLNGSDTATKVWTGLSGADSRTLSYTFTSALTDGGQEFTLKVTNAQSFSTQYSGRLTVDTAAPDSSKIVTSDSATSLIVVSNEPGSAALFTSGGAQVGDAVALTDDNNKQGTFSLVAQSTVQTLTLKVQDIFGQSTTVNAGLVLGTNGIDTLNLSAASKANYIYGFIGSDVITAGNHGDVIYGGADDDVITSGSGADRIIGGSGADAITLSGAGVNTLIYAVDSAAGTSDSNSAVSDTVSGFVATKDVIYVVASGVSSFNSTTDVEVNTAFSNYIGSLNLDGGGTGANAGDLQINFGTSAINTAQLRGALQYDLTGTASANTFIGGGLADRLAGGAGADTLTGGAGADALTGGVDADTLTGGADADTFIFEAGDSTPLISGSAVSGFDVVTDITLLDATTTTDLHDTIDLAGVAVIVANTSGADGMNNGDIRSHAITNGKITFDTNDTYASSLTLSPSDLANIVGYLQSNIMGASMDHQAVVFEVGANSYVFQNNETGGDSLIQLQGTTGIAGLSIDPAMASATNYLFIA